MELATSRVVLACIALVVASLVTAQASAHHSFASEFDRDQPFEVTGLVTSVQWTNPHARIHIDVEEQNGEIVNYDFELGSPNTLMRRGWSKRTPSSSASARKERCQPSRPSSPAVATAHTSSPRSTRKARARLPAVPFPHRIHFTGTLAAGRARRGPRAGWPGRDPDPPG